MGRNGNEEVRKVGDLLFLSVTCAGSTSLAIVAVHLSAWLGNDGLGKKWTLNYHTAVHLKLTAIPCHVGSIWGKDSFNISFIFLF